MSIKVKPELQCHFKVEKKDFMEFTSKFIHLIHVRVTDGMTVKAVSF